MSRQEKYLFIDFVVFLFFRILKIIRVDVLFYKTVQLFCQIQTKISIILLTETERVLMMRNPMIHGNFDRKQGVDIFECVLSFIYYRKTFSSSISFSQLIKINNNNNNNKKFVHRNVRRLLRFIMSLVLNKVIWANVVYD